MLSSCWSLAALVLALAGPTPASAPAAPAKVLHVEPSKFGPILVVEEGNERLLRFGSVDAADQSAMLPDNPAAVPMEYIHWAALGFAFVPQVRDVLVIGLGGGTFPMLARRAYPAARVEAVEIDPAVVRVARRWFGLREDRQLRVVVDDGARFIARTRQRWDVILVDAYGPDGIPEALRSRQFFARLLGHLRPGGIVVLNVAIEEPVPEAELLDVIAASFPDCALVRTPVSDNVVVFGSARLPPADRRQERVSALLGSGRLPFSLPDAGARLRLCPSPHGSATQPR